MTNLREELQEVLKLQDQEGGFHYIQRAQHLKQLADHQRHWTRLLRTPVTQWRRTLADTQYVLDELANLGIP
ncbi:MAG: hypothetical protein AAF959_17135 [Cyanobacteria bacterium P01_D01_bin.56]